jgi:hypothetical protein
MPIFLKKEKEVVDISGQKKKVERNTPPCLCIRCSLESGHAILCFWYCKKWCITNELRVLI